MVMKACCIDEIIISGGFPMGFVRFSVERNMFLMDNLFDFEYVMDECCLVKYACFSDNPREMNDFPMCRAY